MTKETMVPIPAEPSSEANEFSNRKLIRPTLLRGEPPQPTSPGPPRAGGERRERHGGGGPGKKLSPPEQTNAENFYYQKQMQAKTPMVLVLRDGEKIRGAIEWYDKCCIKLNRDGSVSNVLIYKAAIKYMYKESEGVR